MLGFLTLNQVKISIIFFDAYFSKKKLQISTTVDWELSN